MTAWVGISGWTYAPWRGDFYPAGLAHRRELEYAAGALDSIEINGSFYALQRATSYRRWASETPPGFRFSVKAGRFITHVKRLRNAEEAVANFFGSGLLGMGSKLGPILWQLPPTMKFDQQVMADFLSALPRSTGEAAYLARRHDERIEGRAWTGALEDRPLHHAVEVRHNSFTTPAFLDLLRAECVAIVVADTAGKWPQLLEVTADFVYCRLHGADELYTSGYTAAGLELWAGRVRAWQQQVSDVYVYFDNDVKVRAPYDAMALRALVS